MFLPQLGSIVQAISAPYEKDRMAALDLSLAINYPPPCLTGFRPAPEWRSPSDTSIAPLRENNYCRIPQDFQANAVRGARNMPCMDVPGRRAPTPQDCRSGKPYEPLGTNPWFGDPNQILNCPAPGARCNQAVKPGFVIPAPSVNNGLNPLPADRLPPGRADAAAEKRSVAAARLGFRPVQRSTTQPLHLHSGRASSGRL